VLLLVAALLPVLMGAWWRLVSLVGDGTVLALAAFAALGLLAGHFLGGPRPEERTVLALASSSRHPGVAVAIAYANFPGNENVLPAVLLYLIVGAIVAAPYLRWVRR
jgi:BASS family bile acid:Na+ symporter